MSDTKGIILFGDSIFAGTGASNRKFGCSKLIKDSIGSKVYLKGRNRDTSQKALLRLEVDVINVNDALYVICLFGNNDSWLDEYGNPIVSLDQFLRNINDMFSRIISSGKVPIACNLQPIDDDLFMKSFSSYYEICQKLCIKPSAWQKQYSDLIEDYARKHDLPFIDIRSSILKPSQMMSSDGIHPNDLGHKMIASKIEEFMTTHYFMSKIAVSNNVANS